MQPGDFAEYVNGQVTVKWGTLRAQHTCVDHIWGYPAEQYP